MGRGRALTSHKNSEGIYCRIGKQLILTIFFVYDVILNVFIVSLSIFCNVTICTFWMFC